MDTDFTSREGKPVEINALWVHALSEADTMGIGTPVSPESALEAFQRFWNPDRSCLYDRIDPVDPAIRPNQVIALSLGLIPQPQATSALNTVTALLLTPYGLRTLSPSDQDYQGWYSGDRSYHNGCVWPWLTAYYVEALLRNGMPRERIGPILAPIIHHLREAGVGYDKIEIDTRTLTSTAAAPSKRASCDEIKKAASAAFFIAVISTVLPLQHN